MNGSRVRIYLLLSLAFVVVAPFLLIIAMPTFTHAQGLYGDEAPTAQKQFVPLADYSNSPRFRDAYSTGTNPGDSLTTFLNKLFVGGIALGGILAVLRLAWAGFVYMGSEVWHEKEHAKDIIRDTLIGLFVLLSIWLVLYQINPDILKLKVDIKPAQASPAQNSLFQNLPTNI